MIFIRTWAILDGMLPRTQTAANDHGALLAGLGLRATRQRVSVLQLLAAEPNDATAQELHERLRERGERVGLATVYRTLAALHEAGAIDRLSHHPGETCYRLCGEGHHHHLVCSDCHRVVELADCDLGPRLAQLGAGHGFKVTAHSVEAVGVCADCTPA
jgi:Fur family transcriptional regulator, ferric uptake regulator